jgi:FkbM family methyltransferase
MNVQRLLLKLHKAGLLPGPGRRLLERRTWTVEAGEASGLKLGFPQNLDFVRGSTERPVQRCIAEHLVPDDVFYDVGANVGFFSLLATKFVGPGGAVYAVEPVARNAAAIRRNAALNDLRNLSVFEVAADEKSGSAELFVTGWDGGSSLSAAAISASEPVERQAVRVITLDGLIESERLRPPTFIKLDVEGVELRALRGMRKTLEKHRPVLLYEVDDADRGGLEQRWKALDEFVASFGYRVTRLDDSYPNRNWFVGHSLAVPIKSS